LTFALAALLLLACSPAPRTHPDAAPDAGPYCGDGIVKTIRGDRPEMCDDGPRNGAPDSYCTVYCRYGRYQDSSHGYVHSYLGVPAVAAASVNFGWGRGGYAFTAYDETGLVIAPDLVASTDFQPLADTTPIVRIRTMHIPPVRTAPVALGNLSLDPFIGVPIWAERPQPGEAPRLYYAMVNPDLQPTVHELPYPFPDGSHPQIYTPYGGRPSAVVIVDQSANPPHHLLAAVVDVRSPTQVTTTTLRVPAPGRVRSHVISTSHQEEAGGPPVHRLVQFFDDSDTFVALVNVPTPGDPMEQTGQYQLSEFARGRWPTRITASTTWPTCSEYGLSIQEQYHGDPAITFHPPPVMVVTDTGDAYKVQFGEELAGEFLLAPFGQVAPGTRVIGYDAFPSLMGWEPDGSFVILPDGDCRDLRSTALQRQRFQHLPPWATMRAVVRRPSIGGVATLLVDGWLVLKR